MARYNVKVSEQTYEVDLEQEVKECNKDEAKESSADICFDAIKAEYEYCVKRAEKLENKVYILLASCAFIFVLLTTQIEKAGKMKLPRNRSELCVVSMYVILLIIAIVSNVWMLIKAVNLLKSVEFGRFDAEILLTEDLLDEKDTTAVRFIGRIYIQNTDRNNSILNKRYTAFNKCVELFCVSTISLIALAVISLFIDLA